MSSESLSSAEGAEDQQTIGLISNMEARADHQVSKRFRLAYGIATGLGVTLVVMVLAWIVHFRKGFSWEKPEVEFNWHPMLMILGLIFLQSQAMLVYRSARQARKRTLKLWHAAIHCLAFILAVIALKAAFDSHNYANPPKPNLYTLHSWVGLITVVLFGYQFFSGFITFLFPGFSREIRATLLPIHVNYGSVIFMMAVVSAMLGFCEKAIWTLGDGYGQLPSEGVLINFMGVLLVSFGALVVYIVKEPGYKRLAMPEDEISLTGQTE